MVIGKCTNQKLICMSHFRPVSVAHFFMPYVMATSEMEKYILQFSFDGKETFLGQHD